MAEEMNNKSGMSAYEDFRVAERLSRRANGGTVVAIAIGGASLIASVAGWLYAGSRAKGVEKLADAYSRNTEATIDRLASLLAAERTERVAQGVTMSQTITDTIAGTQSGSQNQSQTSAIDNTMQNIMQQTFSDAVTGRSSLNPTPVTLYRAPIACQCPGCGE